MSSVALEVQDKLVEMGGGKFVPFKIKLRRIRPPLVKVNKKRWLEPEVPGRIKRFLHLEQKPSAEEVDEIRAGHAIRCVERIAEHRRADERLFRQAHEFIQRAQEQDLEFYQPHIEALVDALHQLGNMANKDVDESG